MGIYNQIIDNIPEFEGQEYQDYLDISIKGKLYKGWYCQYFGLGRCIFTKEGQKDIVVNEPEHLRGTLDYRWGQWIYTEALRQIDEVGVG